MNNLENSDKPSQRGQDIGKVNLSETNFSNSNRGLLSEANLKTAEQEKIERKRSIIKYSIIGAVIIIAMGAIVGLSLGITHPKPMPPTPDVPQPPRPPVENFNPYVTTDIVDNQDQISGTMSGNPSINKLTEFMDSTRDKLIVGKNADLVPQGPNNQFIKSLAYQMYLTGYQGAYLSIADAEPTKRWTIPDWIVKKRGKDSNMRLNMLGLTYQTNPFSFQFNSLANPSEWYLKSTGGSLVFMDKYIQIDFMLPTQRVFGLGERVREFGLKEGAWTMWARGDGESQYDDGKGGKGTYGVHPFILTQTSTPGEFTGMFFRNSNHQTVILRHKPEGGSTLSYITTGGILEVYFFIRGSANWVISQYQDLVGRPNLPPFWALGFAQSSYAYADEQTLRNVVESYNASDIPLETIFVDIPYMDNFKTFTVNQIKFPNFKNFARDLHTNNQQLVLVLDPALSVVDEHNYYYVLAQQRGSLIHSTINPTTKYNNALVSKVYPEKVVFLDWLHDGSNEVWKQGMKDLYSKVPYDGLWLDMNENTAFVNGELTNLPAMQSTAENEQILNKTQTYSSIKRQLQQSKDQAPEARGWYSVYRDQSQASTFYMPFIAGEQNPDYMTLSLNATHKDNIKEYDFHSLNGHMMSRATFNQWLSEDFPLKDKRVFTLSRSTFSGSGQYSSHWLGDNWRTWEHMRYSISGIMNMNMFGIPHTGADICGFLGKQNDELCARWMQLAVFYPFARNHYNATFEGQVSPGELYKLTPEWQQMAKDAVYQRFEYLRLMYTCLQEVSYDGQTCFSPLFFYYPKDDNTFIDTEHTFMVGGGHLKISPVLNSSVHSIVSYFPKGTWVSMNNFSDVLVLETGKHIQLSAKTKLIQIHLREGSIIPWQPNREHRVKRTNELVDGITPLELVINRDPANNAQGSLFLDRGQTRAELDSGSFEKYQISMNGKYINFQLTNGQRGSQYSNHLLDRIIITNAVDLVLTKWACYIQELDRKPVPLTFEIDEIHRTFSITFATRIPPSIIRDIYFGGEGDINMCSETGYNIKVKPGQVIDLNRNKATFVLEGRDRASPNLIVRLGLLQSNVVKVYINFQNPQIRQRVPYEVAGVMSGAAEILSDSEKLSDYIKLSYYPFQLYVKDEKNATIYSLDSLIFHEYIVQMTALLNTTAGDDFWGIYGLGEKVQNGIFYDDGIYTLWSRDAGDPLEDGKSPGKNIYGTHPVYFGKNDKNSHFGVFNLNAAAQDWIIQNYRSLGEIKVTSIATGGVIDMYLMTGQNPEQVIRKYQQLIGLANFPPPKWALGWHQCRWGYPQLQDIQEVVAKYKEHNIPLDVMWSDIDYMDSYKDFTYDKLRYKELPQFVRTLHTQNQYYIPIIDAGIAWRPNSSYDSYNDGVKQNAFIKARNGEDFVGRVWPNEAVYVDFNAERGREYWRQQLEKFWQDVNFDGLWLDMNEASNFCNGACLDQQKVADPIQNKFMYLPGNRNLETKSIALDSLHEGNQTEADLHSLFGYMQAKATASWFLKHQSRPMIISRSTFAGNQAFGGYHWLGDNYSNEQYMGLSVTGTMMMNVLGIAFTGADICGFGDNTNQELCARWTVVGSFYPFSRNHNSVGAVPQEPYVWQNYYEAGIKYVDIHRMAIRNRYHLTSYYYTSLYFQTFGGTFYKPMFIEFPDDKYCLLDPQNNVMLGSALKLSVLSNRLGQDETMFYFPNGTWCNVYKLEEPCMVTKGSFQTLKTKAYDFYVHLREGFIIPMIDATRYNISTIADLSKQYTDFHILTTPTKPNHTIAVGQLYNDDGITIVPHYNSYILTTDITIGQQIQFRILTTQIPQTAEQGCRPINQNDYLGDLYIYNAKLNGLVGNFTGKSSLKNGTDVVLAEVKYESAMDKVVLRGYHECMALVKDIVLTKTG